MTVKGTGVEAFEQIVKAFLETPDSLASTSERTGEGAAYAVTGPIKFLLPKEVTKVSRPRGEVQHHGYEVDIVAMRRDHLILGSVKSFFGSRGVNRASLGIGAASAAGAYRMFTESTVRDGILDGACQRYGFDSSNVQFALFVGHWATRADEDQIRAHFAGSSIGAGAVLVFDTKDMINALLGRARSKTYVDDPVIVTLKMLLHDEMLAPGLVSDAAVESVSGDDE